MRSCFETAKYPRSISIDEFLNWLKKEPQSIVWLPVMHRLASAEFAKHQVVFALKKQIKSKIQNSILFSFSELSDLGKFN